MLHLLVLVTWLVYIAPEAGAVQRCLHYSQPKNGRIVCDSLFRLFCAPECAPGHVFAFRPAVVYMCGPVTGEWNTYPPGHALPWPDCVKETGDLDSNAMEQVKARRMEISKRIASTQKAIFPKRYTSTSQQNNRYQHLYRYVERARQAYQEKHKTTESVTSQGGRKMQETSMENRQTQGYLDTASNKFSDANLFDASQREMRDTELVNQNQNASNKFGGAYSSTTSQRKMRDTEMEKTSQIKSYRKNASNKLSVFINSSSDVTQREMQDTELEKTNEGDLETASNKFSKPNLSNETEFENRNTIDSPQTESYLENASNELSTLADSARVQPELADQTPRITMITDEKLNSPERTKGERLFYFPIKRDALIRMLPKDLHEKYVDLQQGTAKQTETRQLQKTNFTRP